MLSDGKSKKKDLKRFNHGKQIISGTPECVYDIIGEKYIKQKMRKKLVLNSNIIFVILL